MSFRTWWRHWWPRHRWLISYPPTTDDAQSYMADPAHDPFRDEWSAERSYWKRGRIFDDGYGKDERDNEHGEGETDT